MSKIHIRRTHNLPKEEARARVEDIAKDLKKELNMDYAWQGDSLRFKRTGASGVINLHDDALDLKIDLGLMLSPMKNKIEGTVSEHIDKVLAGKGPERKA